jgi:hypothetical protein
MPTPAQHHQHFPFYAAGIAYCGCKEHFGLTPVQADAELPDDPPTDLTSEIERRRRDLRNIAARKARQRNRQAGAS